MTDVAAPGAPAQVIDARYYRDGATWEKSTHRMIRAAAAFWRTLTIFLGLCLLVSLGAIALLIPLKQTEVVTVEVDKATGFLQVLRPLAESGDLAENEAVTMANIVAWIRARETYDPKGLRDNYDRASLLSTGRAAQDLIALYSNGNSQNPVKLYGPDTAISVQIKSVSFLNERTASVRFSTTLTKGSTAGAEIAHWVANVRWKYTKAPMRMDYRFDNPLGFQVFEYRRDQETVTPTVAKDVQP